MNDLVWKPEPKQAAFLSLPDSIFEALYGGAAGAGKSDTLLLLPLVRGFYKHNKFKGILFRRTYPELESEIIVRSQLWYKHAGAEYNAERKRWKFPSGAIMQFSHLEYESDVHKHDTAEYNYIGFDELTSFTESQYKYIAFTRCRSASRDLPAIVRSGTNPGNIGHAWVRERFVEPAPYKTIIVDKKTKQKRIFIQAFATDNSHLDPGYVARLQLLPEAERRAKLDGDWYTFEGQVFDEWRPVHIEDEPINAVHIVEPFEIPSWWPRFMAIDWGFSAMTCVLWAAISPDDRVYIYREYTAVQTKISTWAVEVGKLSEKEKISSVVMCQSAWQNRGDELTIAEQFENYSHLTPSLADNARIAGKVAIQECLRWRKLPNRKSATEEVFNSDTAAKIMRTLGLDAYKDYIGYFEPQLPETNIPKLQVFNTCEQLIHCIPLCIYDKKNNVTGKLAEDVREFPGDDPYDCLRYLLREIYNYNNSQTKSDHAYNSKISGIVSAYETTGDINTFYRNMETVERTSSESIVPVRKRHGRQF